MKMCSRLLLLGLVIGLVGCMAGQVGANGINRFESIDVGDAHLYAVIRGKNATAPILLWLHGGPGGAERPLFRYYNSELESNFVVVYLDQRGAGRSFDDDADPHKLTVSRHVEDLDVVVDYLLKSFGKERLILVGHSWGGALGLLYAQRYPGKVKALIAVAPLIDSAASAHSEFEFVSEIAQQRHDEKALKSLEDVGEPPYQTASDALKVESIADRYGAINHKPPHKVSVLLKGLLSGLVSPFEISRIIRGNEVTLDAMHDELSTLDIAERVPSLDVPITFFLGRYDRHVDARIANRYFEKLKAEHKVRYWFEESAHNIPFEEPDLFNRRTIETLRE